MPNLLKASEGKKSGMSYQAITIGKTISENAGKKEGGKKTRPRWQLWQQKSSQSITNMAPKQQSSGLAYHLKASSDANEFSAEALLLPGHTAAVYRNNGPGGWQKIYYGSSSSSSLSIDTR